MTHLPAGLRLLLSIYMYKDIIHLQHLVEPFVFSLTGMSIIANNIDNGRRQDMIRITQRITEYDTPKHIELRAIIRLDGVMTAIVNPRSCFIYIHFVLFIDKKFNGKYARTL